MLIAIETATCQAGGGSVEATRMIMMNGEIGGMNPETVASIELGARITGMKKMYGSIIIMITGVISDCASRRSLTAEPIAAIREANMKYARMKYTKIKPMVLGSIRSPRLSITSAKIPSEL